MYTSVKKKTSNHLSRLAKIFFLLTEKLLIPEDWYSSPGVIHKVPSVKRVQTIPHYVPVFSHSRLVDEL